MKIKNNLKIYRTNLNYKQKQVAKKLNITLRQYQRLEFKTPKSVIQFYNLAKYFNTTIDDLLEQDVK